jgi:hypothetical protein
MNYFELPVIVKFDDLEGNIQTLEFNQKSVLIVESFHYFPKYKIKVLEKYCHEVIYIPDSVKLKRINNVQNLKDLKEEFNRKINKYIFEKL